MVFPLIWRFKKMPGKNRFLTFDLVRKFESKTSSRFAPITFDSDRIKRKTKRQNIPLQKANLPVYRMFKFLPRLIKYKQKLIFDSFENSIFSNFSNYFLLLTLKDELKSKNHYYQ